ncbi:MAG: hypothetical protein J0H39_13995 [Alphaproteobacteria bacterium]|nr:hypothetical protein [Alphaproteobacteria bacterium]
MAAAEFVDPFDAPAALAARAAALPPGPPQGAGNFVDPFDKPGALPGAELRAAPAGTKIPDSTVIRDDPAFGASGGAAVLSSLPPDDKGKIRVLSRQMGIPEQQFGVIDGNIVYVGKDGRINRAIPSVRGATGPIDAVKRLGPWLGSEFGPTLPGVAAGAAGIATAPFLGGVPGATAAAGATDVARQAVGNMVAGRDALDIDGYNALGQAAMGGGGQAIARGISALLSRNPLKIAPFDRKAATAPQTQAAAQQARDDAKSIGVDLSFGQATRLPSSMVTERQLARDNAAMDVMRQFFQNQRGQVSRAVDDVTGAISPVQSTEEGARLLREGAGKAVQKAVDERRAVARPAYEKALDEAPPFMNDALATLMKRPSMRDAWTSAQRLAAEEGRDLPQYFKEVDGKLVLQSAPDWRAWDYIKRGLDSVVEGNKTVTGVNSVGRAVARTKDEMLKILDAANPDYAAARKAFAGKSPEIDALTGGPVGQLADKETPNLARDAGALFDFRRIGPQGVAQARAAFERAQQIDQWNAGLSTYLRDQFAAANGSPRQFINRVWGNEANQRERDVLRAAMTPVQWQGFQRLMQTLDHVAVTLPEGSPTATDITGLMALRDQFGGAARAAGRLTSPQRMLDVGGAIGDRVASRMSDEGMLKLAQAVTDPNNLDALKKLRMLGPKSEAALQLAAQLLGQSTAGMTPLRSPADFAPPALSEPSANPR